MPYPKWIQEHLAAGCDLNDEGIEWARTRPAAVKEAMVKIPPNSVVRVVVPGCPCIESGDLCVVEGYRNHERRPASLILVKEDMVRHSATVEGVELVECFGQVTIERVKEVLA